MVKIHCEGKRRRKNDLFFAFLRHINVDTDRYFKTQIQDRRRPSARSICSLIGISTMWTLLKLCFSSLPMLVLLPYRAGARLTHRSHTNTHTSTPLCCSAPSISGNYLQLEADEAVCYLLSWQPGRTVFPLCCFPKDGTAAAHSDTQVNTITCTHIHTDAVSH